MINKKIITICILTLFISIGILVYCHKTYRQPKDNFKATKDNITTTLEVTPKKTSTDPDLRVSTTYVAEVNGKKIEVPVRDTSSERNSYPLVADSATNYTAQLRQEIDVTSLVNKTIPRWEVGIGVGKNKAAKNFYIPIAIQRNYKYNKAIQVELHYNPTNNEVQGVEVMHKWRF